MSKVERTFGRENLVCSKRLRNLCSKSPPQALLRWTMETALPDHKPFQSKPSSWHISVAAKAIAAGQFARCGFDVSVQYGAGQPSMTRLYPPGSSSLSSISLCSLVFGFHRFVDHARFFDGPLFHVSQLCLSHQRPWVRRLHNGPSETRLLSLPQSRVVGWRKSTQSHAGDFCIMELALPQSSRSSAGRSAETLPSR